MRDILKQKFPAKDHISRIITHLKSTSPSLPITNALIYLEGTPSQPFPDSDLEVPFRQSRYFYYVTGCNTADCAYSYDVASGRSTLYIPSPPDERTLIFNGPGLTAADAKAMYDVDDVQVVSNLSVHLYAQATSTSTTKMLLTLGPLRNPLALGIAQPSTPLLKAAFDFCRISKDAHEIEAIREANRVSGLAHLAVMRAASKARNERQLKAVFVAECISHGLDGDGTSDGQAYGAIIAAGTAGATLHYMRDNQTITSDMLNILVDASGEYKCYASDITRTFPISGTFDARSREIYALVLKMQKTCIGMLKAGVDYAYHVTDVAHDIMVEGLLHLGILVGRKEDVIKAGVDYLFLPHGLGHYIGLETHDVGGPRRSPKQTALMPNQTRLLAGKLMDVGPTPAGLPSGSVITVEPGIYFNKLILEPALSNPKYARFLDGAVLTKYWAVGGVRIEDCVLVTETGSENLTTVPKEIEDVEAVVKGTWREDEVLSGVEGWMLVNDEEGV